MDLRKLDMQFRNLAILSESDSPMISCYINAEGGRVGYSDDIALRIREIRKALSADERIGFELALGKIEAFLATELNPEAKGVALFSRAGGEPFFDALQFRVPLPNSMSVDSVPQLYELMVLRDTYHRFVVLISTESNARIVEVSVGNITRVLSAERPDLRRRVGREWTREHYRNHLRERTQKFFKQKIETLDRLFFKEAHTHLVLAGNPRILARVRAALPQRLNDKVAVVLPMPGNASTADVVRATLSTFAEYEQRESLETAGLLLDELQTSHLAVAGTEATLEAIAGGQVDVLVLAESYAAPAGWRCVECGSAGVNPVPAACSQCGEQSVLPTDLKEEMIRAAARTGCTIEIVRNSDVLLDVGGVGCLLLYMTPKQHATAFQAQVGVES